MKKYFFGALTLVGIGLVIGTAGSSDLNLISWNEIIRNTTLGLNMATVGTIGLQRQGVQIFDY